MSVTESQEKAYNYCQIVIESCTTKEQLDSAANLIENFLTTHGSGAMRDYAILVNKVFNKKLNLDYASRNIE
jgi:hypothetical protein